MLGTAGTNRRRWAAGGSDARSKPSRKIEGVPGRHCDAYISHFSMPLFLPGSPSPRYGAHPELIPSSSRQLLLESFLHLEPTVPLLANRSLLLFLFCPCLIIPPSKSPSSPVYVSPSCFWKWDSKSDAFVSPWNITTSDDRLHTTTAGAEHPPSFPGAQQLGVDDLTVN